MAEKQFTRREIENNQDKDNNLFIIHDKVYNVHAFLNEHPGGEEVLIEQKGRDASDNFDDVGHSQDALELMKKYQVGVLVESEKTNKQPKKGWVSGYNAKKTESDVKGTGLPLYLLLGGIAIVVALLIFKS
ncbi:cytochrome b5-like [Pseudomyrmex gracilis]|uniref:cytochrome b5-like n=1 Tax=Pseudomyrmex gracilis TaxID=219809 RepID=UPI000994A9FC|nr:cytochrome b5-like [Pseudomyrmex gracilis]